MKKETRKRFRYDLTKIIDAGGNGDEVVDMIEDIVNNALQRDTISSDEFVNFVAILSETETAYRMSSSNKKCEPCDDSDLTDIIEQLEQKELEANETEPCDDNDDEHDSEKETVAEDGFPETTITPPPVYISAPPVYTQEYDDGRH